LDYGTVCSGPRGVPDPCAVRVRRDRVGVVAEELTYEVVLARSARIAGSAPFQRTERAGRTRDASVRVEEDPHQTPRIGRVHSIRCGEGVVHDVNIPPVG